MLKIYISSPDWENFNISSIIGEFFYMKTLPKITQEFIKEIESNSASGDVTNVIELPSGRKLVFSVFPFVFPIEADFSGSSNIIYRNLLGLEGKSVLDMGTGSGVQAVFASIAGASEVHAVDVDSNAVECAYTNIISNGIENVFVYKSDLFDSVPKGKKFDLIIANLPIVDFDLSSDWQKSILDPDFNIHKRFFSEARNYLLDSGKIFLSHSDFGDVPYFESLVDQAGLKILRKIPYNKDHGGINITWYFYELGL
ncbi:MAG: 50S ribosomal protein L11 methyltransferase [archaeon]